MLTEASNYSEMREKQRTLHENKGAGGEGV